MTISASTRLAQAANAFFRCTATASAFEVKWLRDNTDRQRTRGAGVFGDYGSGARAGTATHAGGDEDHVGAAHNIGEGVGAFFGGTLANLRTTTGTETFGQFVADPHSRRGLCCPSNAWASVLTETNSMPSTPASIMRLTALPPAPPMPTTLICANDSGIAAPQESRLRGVAPDPGFASVGAGVGSGAADCAPNEKSTGAGAASAGERGATWRCPSGCGGRR